MLEGGYDLDALSASTSAVLATLAGAPAAPEAPEQLAARGAEAVVAPRRGRLWRVTRSSGRT